MRHTMPLGALGLLLCCLFAASVAAQITRFDPKQPHRRNLGVWRLTHAPAVRDEGNYHNIQCWSPNGRYTCYTHWGGTNQAFGGKGEATIRVMDFHGSPQTGQ